MPWWLAVLNSLLGVVSAGFGAVAVIRPQTLAPLLGQEGKADVSIRRCMPPAVFRSVC